MNIEFKVSSFKDMNEDGLKGFIRFVINSGKREEALFELKDLIRTEAVQNLVNTAVFHCGKNKSEVLYKVASDYEKIEYVIDALERKV